MLDAGGSLDEPSSAGREVVEELSPLQRDALGIKDHNIRGASGLDRATVGQPVERGGYGRDGAYRLLERQGRALSHPVRDERARETLIGECIDVRAGVRQGDQSCGMT